ncbi:hypothetical protein HDU98_005375 [Podochytrium sp. JEL0797]|nr:hypothetical protein HDU98_005375 [Podochytrium sp. JEL0797]
METKPNTLYPAKDFPISDEQVLPATVSVSASKPTILSRVAGFFPFLSWSRVYSLKHNLPNDIMGGVILACMLIPQAMAYSVLADLPAVYGLYTAIFPPLFFFFFATSPYQNIGPYAVIAVMVSQTATSSAAWLDTQTVAAGDFNQTVPAEVHQAHYEGIVILVTFCVGIIQFAVCILGLGSRLSKILPNALVAGFMSASSIIVLVSQLKEVLGIHVTHYDGVGNLVLTFIDILRKIPDSNWFDFALACLAYACMFCFSTAETFLVVQIPIWYERYCSKSAPAAGDIESGSDAEKPVAAPKKAHVPVCDVILTVIVTALVSGLCNLAETKDVNIIGHIPSGLPTPSAPWNLFDTIPTSLVGPLFQKIASGTFSLALVAFVATYSISKTFEEKAAATAERIALAANKPIASNMTPTATQDLFALSLSTVAASFFGSFVPSSSVSRSAVFAGQTNVTTPLGSLICTGLVMIILSFLGSWFTNVPLSALGTIVILALLGVTKKIRAGYLRIFECIEQAKNVLEAMALVRKEMAAEKAAVTIDGGLESPHDSFDEVTIDGNHDSKEEEVAKTAERAKRNFKKELAILWVKFFTSLQGALLWWVTFLGVVFLEVGTGLLIGMTLALLFLVLEWAQDRMRRSLTVDQDEK